MSRGSIAAVAGFLVLGCEGAQQPPRPDRETHRQEIEAWRQRRIESLRQDDSWLTLVGLYWLEEGEQSFGTNPSNHLVFPAGSGPEFMGSLVVEDGSVRVTANPGVTLTHDEVSVQSLHLRSDAEDEPTVLQMGTLRFYVIDRGGRLALRVKDSQSSARLSFSSIDTYPIDLAWRFEATFEPYDPPRKLPVPNIIGRDLDEPSPGSVIFDIAGTTCRLDAVAESAAEDLFLIFGDETNAEETYGGGRFLYTDPPDEDGRVIVDFNKAYNPPCVFTPYATCPLPPPQNRLPLRVEAGEKAYATAHH